MNSKVDIEYLWECAKSHMFKTAYAILKNDADAEDAVMDAMCRIVKNIAKFENLNDIEIRALSSVYVRRTAIDIYNKNKKLPEQLDECFDIEAIDSDQCGCLAVLKAINTLPSSYRDILLLRCKFDMSDRDIAETLGISHSAVRTRFSRGRAMLMKKLIEMGVMTDE